VFGEAHLRRIVGAYAAYYNEARTHRSLNKDAPSGARLSVSAQSRHNRFSAAFTIDIAESNFRYRQRGLRDGALGRFTGLTNFPVYVLGNLLRKRYEWVGEKPVYIEFSQAGAPGRTRTNTSVRKPDFEAVAESRSNCWFCSLLRIVQLHVNGHLSVRFRPVVACPA
jgi:hypothetical protein